MEIAFIAKRHVNIGIDPACAPIASTDGNEDTITIAAVNQMMAVWRTRRPRRNIARSQNRFGIILNQHRLARQHDDNFIFLVVPVPV